MPQRVGGFIVACLLIFPGFIFSQENSPEKQPLKKLECEINFTNDRDYSGSSRRNFSYFKQIPVGVQLNTPRPFNGNSVKQTSPPLVYNPIARDLYSRNLGFFCRKELELDKTSFIPLRFRLGSVEYVNRMERKF